MPPDVPADRQPDLAPRGVPVPLTTLVGREREIAAVRELLAAARLLTLTGVGGAGKTRLALEVARRVAADGTEVAWVDLAPLDDPALLPNQVAAALGVEEGTRPVAEALLDALRGREALLVLDNCEHLVDACAELVERLLRASPAARVLATSREALGVGGERAWLLPALSLPAPGGATAAAAAESEAVRLFVDRAQAALATFALTDANAAAVAQVCRRLDGLPLAIELAAARVRSLTPEQIAARLDDSFRLLTTGGRTAVPRHRTLREAIDWSYDLLDDDERALLQRLSAFAGEFPLEAAEAVCGDDELPAGAVLDLLAALVDKSLVVMREAGGTARYHLLETIRQYARERLEGAGRADAVRARHARHYAALVREAAPHFITARRPEWVERVQQELDNVRVALAWTREREPALHVALAGMLCWFWYSAGLWGEGRRSLEEALALDAAGAPTPARAAVLFAAGVLASLQGEPARAVPWLEESAAIAGATGDARLRAYALAYLGVAVGQEGRDEAEVPASEALAWFREAGDLYGHRLALLVLVTMRLRRGELETAREGGEEAARVARAFGLPRELGIALQILGTVVLHQGDLARAAALLAEALDALRRDPQTLWVARALELVGVVASARGDPLRAARLFGAAEAGRELIGAALFRLDRDRLAPHVAAARAAAGEAAFAAAWAGGRALPLLRAAEEAAHDARTVLAGPVPAAPDADEAAPAPDAPDAPGAAPVPVLRVRALGPLEIERDGVRLPDDAWRYAKPRELLLYLLAHPEGRTREQVGLAFWPDASATQVKNSFHVTLHHLRKALGRADLIAFHEDRYRVHWTLGVELDAATFEAEARAAMRALRAARDAAGGVPAAARLRAALAIYRGDFLVEETVGDWHLEIRDRLARLHADALRALGAWLERAGAWTEAADVYRRALSADPLDEEAARRLMRALARAGERGQALRQYERLVALLRAELDAEPEPETTALHDRLRRAEAV